ncbi:MAG: hypothetical protein SFX72_19685 [Isosphaeraceae bacterium]|nr:hypothetical protein [Isosphaeraceae bacterium]
MLTPRYATDEDLALRIHNDYPTICPRDQKLAGGVDGMISGSDRWLLQSASVDFSAQGITEGNIVTLTKPTTAFHPPGESFAVESVDANGVRLRRKGHGAGIGQPPATPAGLVGIEFVVLTFGPQVANAAYELERRFGISSLENSKDPESLVDSRALREATILTVLYKQYLELSRESSGDRDTFAAKSQLLKAELDQLLARLTIHLRSSGHGPGFELRTRFNTRISR